MLSAKIAFRSLPRRKTRTILTVAAVLLGVALLVGINMATASAMGEFTNYINKFWGRTDLTIRYGLHQPFNAGNSTLLRQVPEIRQLAGRVGWFGSLDNETIFQLVGIESQSDFEYASLNITGASSLGSASAVVANTLALKYGLDIGSRIIIRTSDSHLNNVSIALTVAGIEHPLRNIGATVYVDRVSLQTKIALEGRITDIFATIDNPGKALLVREEVQKLLPLFDVSAPKAEAVQRIQGQMAGFQLGLNVMVAVSLVVCSFIVFNTLFMAVNERTYEIGVMRAVGTSRRQIFRIFLAEGLIIGTVGAILGLLAGFILSELFITVFEENFGVQGLPQAQLTPALALTGFAAGLAAVVAGALYPAVSASRTDVLHAIRPEARNPRRRVPESFIGIASAGALLVGGLQAFRLTPFHVSYLDVILVPFGLVMLGAVIYGRAGNYLAAPIRVLSGGVGYVASQSGRRRVIRNAVSFGMITITLSFVIMLGGIQAGVQTSIEQSIREALGADIFLVANQSISISFANSLVQIPQVSTATPLGVTPVPTRAYRSDGNGTSVGVLAVDPVRFPTIIAYNFVNSPRSEEVYSQLAVSNETVLMPDTLARTLAKSAGDSLNITTSLGFVSFKVVGIFTGPVFQYLRFGESFASESVVVSFASQQKYFGGKLDAPIFLVNLRSPDKPHASTIAHDIAARYPKYDLAENSVTLSEILALVKSAIEKVFAVILLILYFALLIAILGIGATMMMSVADRRREIGLLRSQGMSRLQIAGLFIGEGVSLGLFGFLLALPGGLLLLRGATNSTTIAGFWLPFIIPWSAIFQSLILAFLAVFFGTLYPAIRASRMEITEALEQV